MREEIRRLIVFSATGRIKGQFPRTVYSYDRGTHSHMSNGYDYEIGAHFSGVKSGNLYHYGTSSHIQLKVNGTRFSGYDYDSGAHFQGTISGKQVNLYDYEDGRYYSFSA